MYQKTCKTLGYMEIIVFEIAHRGSKSISIPWPIQNGKIFWVPKMSYTFLGSLILLLFVFGKGDQ